MKAYASVNDYLKQVPAKTRPVLRKLRATILKAANAPGMKREEVIAYGIPTVKLDGKNLVHYAAFRAWVSFFPGGSARAAFKETKKYEGGKGTLQFPLDKTIPYGLVARITKWRVAQVLKAKKPH